MGATTYQKFSRHKNCVKTYHAICYAKNKGVYEMKKIIFLCSLIFILTGCSNVKEEKSNTETNDNFIDNINLDNDTNYNELPKIIKGKD